MSKKIFPGMAIVTAMVAMASGSVAGVVPSMPMRGEDLPPPIFRPGRGRVRRVPIPSPRTRARGGFPWPKHDHDQAAIRRAEAKRARKRLLFLVLRAHCELRKYAVRSWIEDFSDQVRRDRWADEDERPSLMSCALSRLSDGSPPGVQQ